ncbi:putative cellulose-binding GDSL lipase/acylhydrolase [Aspergillus brunneoviolaceus CBS 621.78]|uniref:Uncharacterized protein n=1 Tax=Aspergillus brunneoviolaceus CBS 621.78 TaxID=1450534 RepID=A0ACD1GDI9_9EURO|nr:hypothetical protein BO95DRAFT_451824 [Aspergillus brunneoviolaceus CBS 621.78]RAH47336.1 hypothetical protein BO95DRAFT_451824 [Aspergillus brunneoviolaceus CBS 621.78]
MCLPSNLWVQHDSAATTKYVISFGDSYTSTTFDITGTKPSAANPLGNPPYPGWTASGGTNWISDIVAKYNNSLLLSYNLAYGGATVNASLVAPYLPTVYSIIDQVDEFQEDLSPPPSWAPWDAKNTLFAVWIGVNDVAGSWYQTSAAALEREILDQLFEQIEHVYQGGARNFALLTVPPIERTPNIMQGSDPDYTIPRLKAAIEHWNTILVEKVEVLAQTHHDAIVKVVDTQPVFNNILDSGGAAADCWNPDGVTCLWFNDFHPGIVIQDAVAQAVAAAWKGSFFT